MSAAVLINADLVNADLIDADAEAERDAWEPNRRGDYVSNDTRPVFVYAAVPISESASIGAEHRGEPAARWNGHALTVQPTGSRGVSLIMRSPDEWRRISEVVESAIAEGGSDAGH